MKTMKTQLIEEAYAHRAGAVCGRSASTPTKALAAHCSASALLAALLAGGRRDGLRKPGRRPHGRHPGHGQLPGQSPQHRGAACRHPQGQVSYIPGTHRLNLHEIYGEFGGETVDRDQVEPRHFAGLDRVGERARHEARLQLDVVLAPQERRSLSLANPDPGDPGVLGGAHQALPRHRRSDGRGAGRPLYHEPVGARRVERPDGEPDALPRAAARLARPDLRDRSTTT